MAGGRPTKYKAEYVEQAKKCCGILGATDEQLAQYFDVNVATIYRWKNAHPEFSEAIKSKEDADREVENSLYKTALSGNTTAQIFWLKNRKKDEWREKQEIDHSNTDGTMRPTTIEIVTPNIKDDEQG